MFREREEVGQGEGSHDAGKGLGQDGGQEREVLR